MRDGKEGEKTGRDFPYSWVRAEGDVEDDMSGFMQREPDGGSAEEFDDFARLRTNRRRGTAEHRRDEHCSTARGTQVAPFPNEAQQLL